MQALNESRLVPDALQMIDIEPVNATGSSEPATVVRAHHQAAGAKRGLRDRVSAARAVASRPRSTCASTAQARL